MHMMDTCVNKIISPTKILASCKGFLSQADALHPSPRMILKMISEIPSTESPSHSGFTSQRTYADRVLLEHLRLIVVVMYMTAYCLSY